MQPIKLSRTLASIAVIVGFTAITTSSFCAAAKEKVLHAFSNRNSGANSYSSLIFDSDGNLYGTTQRGGELSVCDGVGCGVVFKLTPASKGQWKETVLYTFHGGKDGAFPSAGLTFDSAGNLYGTAELGGDTSAPLCQTSGCGVVFKLTPDSTGHWRQSVLHRFSGKDGANPFARVTFDLSGNLYGTTVGGGNTRGDGVAFRLALDSKGKWKETVLHRFTGGKDGALPFAGVILDAAGNLYGATYGGGNLSDCSGFGCGVVFQLTPSSNGPWKENVLHTFAGGKDGATPYDLVLDSVGNLYSTTNSGGTQGNGTAFELSPSSGGRWKKTVLHNFGRAGDGGGPGAGLILDTAGNLYGTTIYGGSSCGSGCGIIFKLTPLSNGHWQEHVLYSFRGGNDGGAPAADLAFDPAGNLFGTTPFGGVHNVGVVFEVSP
jgi:uncharacterized repeat protein (TIGR03803 family)